ncbi:MAG: glutamate 5-kinase [Bradymonadaceae bacterium]
MTQRTELSEARHWIIKIGSSVFLRDERHVDRPTFAGLVRDVDALLRQGHRVTIVSSGAVALGRERLGWPEVDGDSDITDQQALAALGQSRLVQMYESELSHYDRKVAQILFSRADLDDRERFLNARRALRRVHQFGAVPIINENASVATEELRFGDNDRLAAMTCGVEQADLLVLLSDVDGIYDVEETEGGERVYGDRLSAIGVGDTKLDEIAGPSDSDVGTGGMVSKVIAARMAARVGAPTVVAPGKRPGILEGLQEGRDLGTYIDPGERDELAGKKVWLGAGARAVGTVYCDAGARRAVVEQGASLLPSGITEIEGEFGEGGVVELRDEAGELFARGVAVYGAEDLREIAGRHSESIEEILGYRIFDCTVHRDSLVLLSGSENGRR